MPKKINSSLFFFVTTLSLSLHLQAPSSPKRFTTEEQAIKFATMIQKYHGVQPPTKKPSLDCRQTTTLLPNHAETQIALAQHVSPRKMNTKK